MSIVSGSAWLPTPIPLKIESKSRSADANEELSIVFHSLLEEKSKINGAPNRHRIGKVRAGMPLAAESEGGEERGRIEALILIAQNDGDLISKSAQWDLAGSEQYRLLLAAHREAKKRGLSLKVLRHLNMTLERFEAHQGLINQTERGVVKKAFATSAMSVANGPAYAALMQRHGFVEKFFDVLSALKLDETSPAKSVDKGLCWMYKTLIADANALWGNGCDKRYFSVVFSELRRLSVIRSALEHCIEECRCLHRRCPTSQINPFLLLRDIVSLLGGVSVTPYMLRRMAEKYISASIQRTGSIPDTDTALLEINNFFNLVTGIARALPEDVFSYESQRIQIVDAIKSLLTDLNLPNEEERRN